LPEERRIVRVVDEDRLDVVNLGGRRHQTRGLGASAGRERFCVPIATALGDHGFERQRLDRLRPQAIERRCGARA
jgi:hypothetical protein